MSSIKKMDIIKWSGEQENNSWDNDFESEIDFERFGSRNSANNRSGSIKIKQQQTPRKKSIIPEIFDSNIWDSDFDLPLVFAPSINSKALLYIVFTNSF